MKLYDLYRINQSTSQLMNPVIFCNPSPSGATSAFQATTNKRKIVIECNFKQSKCITVQC